MKLRQLLTTLAAAVGLTTAATAATPTVLWDGDFGTTKSGFTLNANGNTVASDGSTITIGSANKGVLINYDTEATPPVTILFKYSNLTLGKDQIFATLWGGNATIKDNRVGYRLDSSNNGRGVWNDAVWNNVQGTAF